MDRILKNQPNFNFILDVPPEKQGVCRNWTLTNILLTFSIFLIKMQLC